jgi:hypothetical protein
MGIKNVDGCDPASWQPVSGCAGKGGSSFLPKQCQDMHNS